MYKLRITNTKTELAVHTDHATEHSLSLAFISIVAQCLIEDTQYHIVAMDGEYRIKWEATV